MNTLANRAHTRRLAVWTMILVFTVFCGAAHAGSSSRGLNKRFGHSGFVVPDDHSGSSTDGEASCAVDNAGNLFVFSATITNRALNRQKDDDGGFIIKYNSAGVRARHFGKRGVVTHLHPKTQTSITVDSAGRPILLTAGPGVDDYTSSWRLSRLTKSGKPDNGFGNRGSVKLPFANPLDGSPLVAPLRNGRIAIGASELSTTVHQPSSILVLTANGKRDPSFDGDGLTTNDFAVNTIVELANGDLQLSGSSEFQKDAGNDIRVKRLLPDGSLDTAWNSGGTFGQSLVPESVLSRYYTDPTVVRPAVFFHNSVKSSVLADGSTQLSIVTDAQQPTDAGEYFRSFAWTERLDSSGAVSTGYGTQGANFFVNLDQSISADDPMGDVFSFFPLQDGRVQFVDSFHDGTDSTLDEVTGKFIDARGSRLEPSTTPFRATSLTAESTVFDPAQHNAYVCGYRRDGLVVAKFRIA